MPAKTKTRRSDDEDRRHREQLGDVGPVIRLAPFCADPFVGRHGHVPTVEGDHRQHVQDPEHDVDGDQEKQDGGQPGLFRLRTEVGDADDGDGAGVEPGLLTADWAALEFVTWW